MIIQFRENWRLRSGDDQWVLEKGNIAKKGPDKGKMVWRTIGFFTDPRRAVVASWRLQVLEQDETPSGTLSDVLNRLDDLYEGFQKTLDEVKGKM